MKLNYTLILCYLFISLIQLLVLPVFGQTTQSNSLTKSFHDILEKDNNHQNIFKLDSILNISRENNFDSLTYACHLELMNIYNSQGLFEQAANHMTHAFRLDSVVESPLLRTKLYLNKSALDYESSRIQSSIQALNKSLSLAKIRADTAMISKIYLFLARSLLEGGNNEDSVETCIKSAIRYGNGSSKLYSAVGGFYSINNNIDSAIYYSKRGLMLAQNNEERQVPYINLSINYRKAKDLKLAKAYSDSVIFFSSNESKGTFSSIVFESERAFLLSEMGFKDSALIVMYAALKELRNSNTQVAQEKLLIFESVLNLNQLKLDKSLLKARNRMLIIIVLFLVLLSVTVAYFFYALYHQKSLVEKEVIQKTQILAKFAQQSSNKSHIMKSVVKLIDKVKANDNIRQEIKIILKQSIQNNDSQEIDNQILIQNTRFLKKLKKKYPNLTENEIQLCILLRSETNSKQIAVIKNVEVGSVYVARNRLRSSLGITDSNVNLTKFLQSI